MKPKTLQAHDLIQIETKNTEDELAQPSRLCHLFVGLIDLLDIELAVRYVFEHDLHECLFTAIQLLNWRYNVDEIKHRLIIAIFCEAVRQNNKESSFRIVTQYEASLLAQSGKVIPVLLDTLTNSPFNMEIKLQFIQRLLHRMNLKDSERLLVKFEYLSKQAATLNGIIFCNTSPILVICTILEISAFVKKHFSVLKNRTKIFEKLLLKDLRTLLDEAVKPY